MGKIATSFEQAINSDRSRKKNEALAAKIFGSGSNRRASAPNGAGSLASRAGVQKRVSSHVPRGPAASGNIDGGWTHDLHDTLNGPQPNNKPKSANTSALASRITVPGAIAPSKRQQRRAAQVAQALIKMDVQPGASPASGASGFGAANKGLSIRGLAGPYVIMAQNFAPGTTAADIESAMTPVGGIITSCRLLKTQPIVIAELVFESRDGAERVISNFNNQTADGRVLHVYPKVGGASAPPPPTPATPTGPKAMNSVIDGKMGFADPAPRGGGNGRLYSDSMVSRNTTGPRAQGQSQNTRHGGSGQRGRGR